MLGENANLWLLGMYAQITVGREKCQVLGFAASWADGDGTGQDVPMPAGSKDLPNSLVLGGWKDISISLF